MSGLGLLASSRSFEDELMLTQIGHTNPNNPGKLSIYDARQYINAMANRMNKGGFENISDHYTNCSIDFLEIENIHGVRDACNKMYEIAKYYDTINV